MSGRRKASRRPYATKYRASQNTPRPVSNAGGGQGGILGSSSASAGGWG
jgi:hypothetical protein